jgi:hypothetical protein
VQDCDSFVMVLVDGDGMPVSAPLRALGLLAAMALRRMNHDLIRR